MNNIIRILALGAVWLAKGPKIAGQSYYSFNVELQNLGVGRNVKNQNIEGSKVFLG